MAGVWNASGILKAIAGLACATLVLLHARRLRREFTVVANATPTEAAAFGEKEAQIAYTALAVCKMKGGKLHVKTVSAVFE